MNPYKILFIIFVFTALILTQLPEISIDTSVLGMLHEDAKEKVDYDLFKSDFGQDEMIIVGIETADVLNMSFLKTLRSLHNDLEHNSLYIEKITSLLNARDIRGYEDELIVEDLFENWPENEFELDGIKTRIFENPTYTNTILSEDLTFTALILEPQAKKTVVEKPEDILAFFDNGDEKESSLSLENASDDLSDKDRVRMIKTLFDITGKYSSDNFRIFIAGTPVLVDRLNSSIRSDMRKFIVLTFLVVAIFLFIIFRRVAGMLMPIFIVIISLLVTIAIMVATGGVLKMPTSILPSFILAVGICDSVHVMTLFFRKYQETNDKLESVTYAFGHSGFAILITSLTTACGLLSLYTAEIAPVADLGIYGSIGVMIAFVYTVLLLPALIAVFPVRQFTDTGKTKRKKRSVLDTFFEHLALFTSNHPVKILLFSSCLLIAVVLSYPKLYLAYNSVEWFPENNPFRLSVEKINEKLRGSLLQEIVLDFNKDLSLHDPSIMSRIDAIVDEIQSIRMGEIYVGKVISLNLFLKKIHQALNENKASYYSIPDSENLISQEFLLYESRRPDDLYEYTDLDFSRVRISLKVPYIDAIAQIKLLNRIKTLLCSKFPEAEVTITGLSTIYCSMIAKTSMSMIKSYGFAFVAILIMMILLCGRFSIALLGMIPNVLPVMFILGLMAYMRIPIDPFTMLVGSIAIGLSVDDTIHFIHQYTKYFEQKNDSRWAIQKTLDTTGRALLVTTCVLSSGFFVYQFATMGNLRVFGFLTGLTILFALLADFLVCPCLLTLIDRKKIVFVTECDSLQAY